MKQEMEKVHVDTGGIENKEGSNMRSSTAMEIVEENDGKYPLEFMGGYGKYVLDMLGRAVLCGWTTEVR